MFTLNSISEKNAHLEQIEEYKREMGAIQSDINEIGEKKDKIADQVATQVASKYGGVKEEIKSKIIEEWK